MTRLSPRKLLLICMLMIAGCGKPLPAFKDVDLKSWKDDPFACLGKRSTMLEKIEAQKNILLGLDEIQLVTVLGKPDQQELYSRNQKFYRYFIQPGESCKQPLQNAKKLVVRFNAVGLAKEVTIE